MNRFEQIEAEELRRALLEILNESPRPLHLHTVRNVLDQLNHPTTWRNFLEHLRYLTGEELVRVFRADTELNNAQEAKHLALIAGDDSNSQEARQTFIRIRQRGIRFLEGYEPEVRGVATR